ncbi:MAG: hypothetical protein II786_07780, partial [Muribaculaceae bacterium]|nr:hypothetical protein [Muribaculaceae bacterium]
MNWHLHTALTAAAGSARRLAQRTTMGFDGFDTRHLPHNDGQHIHGFYLKMNFFTKNSRRTLAGFKKSSNFAPQLWN